MLRQSSPYHVWSFCLVAIRSRRLLGVAPSCGDGRVNAEASFRGVRHAGQQPSRMSTTNVWQLVHLIGSSMTKAPDYSEGGLGGKAECADEICETPKVIGSRMGSLARSAKLIATTQPGQFLDPWRTSQNTPVADNSCRTFDVCNWAANLCRILPAIQNSMILCMRIALQND